jgi:phospholipase C
VSDPAPRQPGSLPFPDSPPGTVNEQMPFDHVVVVMMENHSFDDLLGDLGRTRPDVDALTFDAAGNATNSNPDAGNPLAQVRSLPCPNTAQAKNITQAWKATHEQIDGGKMDGFVRSEKGAREAMGYYTPEVLPFAYSLASTFTLANHWFSSVPGPTYPNRRFLLAGTAFGGTATNKDELLAAFETPPPNGTIFDHLSEHGLSWASYSTDIPMTLVIPRILTEHPLHHHRCSKFLEDCKAGTLPQVSFVDPATGKFSSIADSLNALPKIVKEALDRLDPGESEEDPDDMYYGERWAHETVEAVLRSPAWPRTLLIYTYDEHGGYYDHVPPPAAIAPDDIAPKLGPGESGDYSIYGVRVPTVVVSPYSRPGGVSNVPCDHTSVLATIEAKWNLPALTNRDANAATIMDFLDPSQPPMLDPPLLDAPLEAGPSGPASPPRRGGPMVSAGSARALERPRRSTRRQSHRESR